MYDVSQYILFRDTVDIYIYIIYIDTVPVIPMNAYVLMYSWESKDSNKTTI